jgi:fatty-acid desaturase
LRWWEIDITYYVLRIFSVFGIARDLRHVTPSAILKAGRTIERYEHLES